MLKDLEVPYLCHYWSYTNLQNLAMNDAYKGTIYLTYLACWIYVKSKSSFQYFQYFDEGRYCGTDWFWV